MNSQENTTIKISGMSCSGCANTVEKAIAEIDGVQEVSVNLKDNSASVKYESDKISSEDFRKAVEEAGYSFEGVK